MAAALGNKVMPFFWIGLCPERVRKSLMAKS